MGSELDTNGIDQFGITESVVPTADGVLAVKLRCEFTPPRRPDPSGVNVPLVSLSPAIGTSGGTLEGGTTYYYAVSAKDGDGAASGLSFAVRAKIPAGGDTNTVTIGGLSFSPTTASFNVYRGFNPAQLLLIAADQTVAETFIDTGLTASLEGPPDGNYSHANFYWRLELQPEANVETHSLTTVGNSTLGMLPDNFKGAIVRITQGTGRTQERVVVTNDATTLTVSPPWRVEPDTTSFFVVAESTFKFGGVSSNSPTEIEVPARLDATVQISGRSANVHNIESAYELNPLTRWQIGTGGEGSDTSAPPAPVFGLNPVGKGTVELLGIGFLDLTNTRTIAAGTLSLLYWDELSSPTLYSLAADISDTDTTISVTPDGPGLENTILQIGSEILIVEAALSGGAEYEVRRGEVDSTATPHDAGDLIYHLSRKVEIASFGRGFFGSPASGSYSHAIYFPDVRIAGAELYMSNSVGDGIATHVSFGLTLDQGIRTLSGGQISFQVEGYLAVENDATAALVMEDSHSVRDVFAIVREAPDRGPWTELEVPGTIELTIRQDDDVYCTLTIAEGALQSNTVDGFGLPPLVAGSKLNLDITAVPGAANTLPGRDLTVIIRL